MDCGWEGIQGLHEWSGEDVVTVDAPDIERSDEPKNSDNNNWNSRIKK